MRIDKAAFAIILAACASRGPTSSTPGNVLSVRYSASPATVLVTNTTGLSLDIRATLSLNPPMPQPLGGMLHLGSVASGGSACLQVPDTVSILLTNATTGQQQTVVWTSSDAFALSGVDTTAVTEHGYTAMFVPTSSGGWSVAFPSTGATPTVVARCTT